MTQPGTLSSNGHWISATPWIVLLGFFGLSFLYWIFFSENGAASDPGSWGQFGDYIGGILNPLVATFALLALVTSIRIQKEELKESRCALEKQTALSNFFSLLQQHRELVNTVKLQHRTSDQHEWRTQEGRDAFAAVIQELEWDDNGNVLPTDLDEAAALRRFTLVSKKTFVPQYWFSCWYCGSDSTRFDCLKQNPFKSSLESSFGHVFRSIYQTLKFIYNLDPQLFSAEQKEALINYLRAQMSEDEFILFALSALTETGQKSRAVAIALNFFQSRMQNGLAWVIAMRPMLECSDDNASWARTLGYKKVT